MPGVDEERPRPEPHERKHALDQFVEGISGDLVARSGRPDQVTHREWQFTLVYYSDEPDGLTSQGIWILRASRYQADRKTADYRVDLVCNAQDGPGRRLWQGVPGELGQVVLVDGGRDLGRLAGLQGVLPPHNALQLRELLPVPDHLGHEVGLRQPCGADRRVERVGCHDPGNIRGEQLQSLGLLVERPDTLQPHNVLEPLDLALERASRVLLPVELGVVQPRLKHTLVTFANDVVVILGSVDHAQEVRQEHPVI